MSEKITVLPKIRGFICTTAHAQGCYQNVLEQIKIVQSKGTFKGPLKVLIIGGSTGYGLATRITAAFGARAQTLSVAFERPAVDKRTASAGWYNTAAFEKCAQAEGLYAKSINGDAFSNAIKEETVNLIKKDWQGEVDLVIYSLASPRRQDPNTGDIYQSVLKPIESVFKNKTVDVMTGKVSEVAIEPANATEIEQTVKVMGGEDWQLWMELLAKENLLAKGVLSIAYSYIGPQITYAVYHQGTIGRAKAHLEQTAKKITELLKPLQGHAYISINKALVTQASAAIPVVPLYISLLYKVMREKNIHEGCIEQMDRLFRERLYQNKDIPLDSAGRIRVDDWEMREDVQADIANRWQEVDTDNVLTLSDLQLYRKEFERLFGFGFANITYEDPIDIQVAIPSIKTSD